MKTRSATVVAGIHPGWLLGKDMFRSWCRSSRAERGKHSQGAKSRLHLHSCFLASLAVGPNPSPSGVSLTLEQDLGNGATPATNRRIALRPVPMQGRPHGFRRGARKAWCLRWHEMNSRRTPFARPCSMMVFSGIPSAPGQPDNQEGFRPGRDTMIQRCPFEECSNATMGYCVGASLQQRPAPVPPFSGQRAGSAGRKNGREARYRVASNC